MSVDLVLRPRDGLTLKDARGFEVAGGVTADGLPWPAPATVAGAARTVVGGLLGFSYTNPAHRDRWLGLRTAVSVLGPVILSRPLEGGAWTPLWPAPLDAVRLADINAATVDAPAENVWLEPVPRGEAEAEVRGSWRLDSPDDPQAAEAEATEALHLPLQSDRRKPLDARRLWSHEEILSWLAEPRSRQERSAPQPCERRDVHLGINPETLTAREEYLYIHSTYESVVTVEGASQPYELAIGLRVCGVDVDLTEAIWRVGGEARIAIPELLDPDVLAPAQKGLLLRRWTDSQRLRLFMVTPARFRAGWRPDWLKPEPTAAGYRFRGTLPVTGHHVELRAAFVDRPQWLSGWDMAAHRPKPSVACVPAGAVYYLESLGQPFTAKHIAQLWLATLQTAGSESACDGFGLILPGAWPSAA